MQFLGVGVLLEENEWEDLHLLHIVGICDTLMSNARHNIYLVKWMLLCADVGWTIRTIALGSFFT